MAFLQGLERLGTVAGAADAAGFCPSTAYRYRKRHPAFAAKWDAIARPPREATRGVTRYGPGGRAKRVRCRTQWSDEVEARFLDALAATCNVSAAAAEAGVSTPTVYHHRLRRADFATRWQAALGQGYARLEIELVRAATDALTGARFDADRPIPPVSAETAIKLLQMHRAAVTGQGRRPGTHAAPPPIEEVRADILRKAAAIRAARLLPPGRDGAPG